MKEWLDKHMAKAEQGIRFIDPHYKEKFRIPDGGKIIITYDWGEKAEKSCRIFVLCNLYHICEFAERMERNGHTYEPKPEDVQTAKAPKKKEYER